MKTLVLLLSSLPLLAQVAEPRAGVVTGRDGAVREVIGVAGAFLPGDTLLEAAVRAAASGDFWVAKLDRSIRTSRGDEFEAPPGDAIIGISSRSAWIFIRPSENPRAYRVPARLLWRLTSTGGVDTTVCPPERGTLIALAGDLTLYIRRNDGLHAVSIRPSDCAVESDTRLDLDAAMAVALADGTLVVARDSSVVIRDPAGALYPFDLPDPPQRLSQMAATRVQIRTASANFALDLTSRRLYQLPEVAQ